MYRNVLENIVVPIGDVFNRTSYMRQLKYWRKVDTYTLPQLENLQKENLKEVLAHSVNTVPYYKNIDLKGSDPYLWLNQFPVVTKNHLREQNSELISANVHMDSLIKYSSSGSSGIQSTVYMSKAEQSIIRGILTHWWEWSGYGIGSPIVQTGMTLNRSAAKSLKDFFFRTYYVNAFSLSEEQLQKVCRTLENTKSHFLVGYASSLQVIAAYALEHKFNIRLKAVISLGDKLFTHYKSTIEKAFHCKVYDTYGSNEGLMIAAQKDIDYLYILSPHVYLEIVDDSNNPVPDGEMGHILVTRLDGFSMPLIRYKIGDLGILLPKEKYPKHREFQYPLLQQIVGRETDIITLPSGKKLTVHSFTGIFEYIPEIKQFKVIQERSDAILIEYIEGRNFTENALEKAEIELREKVEDTSFSIEFIKVRYIAPTKSGKPQIIESKL